MFPKVLHGYLYIWRRIHLQQSLLTGFGRERASISPARAAEASSGLFCEYASSTCCSLTLLLTQAGCRQPVLAFWVVLNAQVCVLSSSATQLGQLLCVLISLLQSLTLAAVGGAHRELLWCGCVGEVCRALGVPMGQLGTWTHEVPQQLAHLQASW